MRTSERILVSKTQLVMLPASRLAIDDLALTRPGDSVHVWHRKYGARLCTHRNSFKHSLHPIKILLLLLCQYPFLL